MLRLKRQCPLTGKVKWSSQQKQEKVLNTVSLRTFSSHRTTHLLPYNYPALRFAWFETSYCKRNRDAGCPCIILILFCIRLIKKQLNTSLAHILFENFLLSLFLPYCLCPLSQLGQTVRQRLERSFNNTSRPA